MREPIEHVDPGDEVKTSVSWRSDDTIRPGSRVEATDGSLGVVRERRVTGGPEEAYLGVETDDGLMYLPERLVRETHGDTVFLSLPAADAKAQAQGPLQGN
jgi:hypothetical protein